MHDILAEPAVRTELVELRQYTLHPRTRETLIGLFDDQLVEPQEECGMSVIGQFRDLDRPNRFVWLRGFPDMASRARALAAFYEGPVWAKHRDAANATMIDFDDVRLLRPAAPDSGFRLDPSDRPARGAPDRERGFVTATILHLNQSGAEAFPDLFQRTLRPVLIGAGATLIASFVTEPSPNNFPRLPVREGETVFVWFAGFDSVEAHRGHRAELMLSVAWQDAMADAANYLRAPPEVLRLAPTARSLLGGEGLI